MFFLNLTFTKYNLQNRVLLVKVARGLEPADTILSNINLVEVNTGSILEDVAILIKGSRIAGIVSSRVIEKYRGRDTIVINGKNSYALPGFIDLHIHIESSMLDPIGFAKIALQHGTTTVVADPHEIVNVLGLKGLEVFSKVSRLLPLKILLEIPSCIPPTDPAMKLETPPSNFTIEEVKYALSFNNIIGLGEVMDFISVLEGSSRVYERIKLAVDYNLVVDGHAPLFSPEELNAYIAAGITSDHESVEIREAYEKAWRGMYLYIREGSAWRDLEALVDIIKRTSCKLCVFVSDDVNILDLFERGHMDRVINRAIELGVDPIKAIQLSTINPAIRLHLEDHIGIIAPGRLGDIVLVDRLEKIEPTTILANGELIYFNGIPVKTINSVEYPSETLNTVKINPKLVDSIDITPRVSEDISSVKVNVIRVQPGSTITKHVVEELNVSSRRIQPSPRRDIMYVGVLYRYSESGGYSVGFIENLGFKLGAVAQTIAHDTHNIVFAGWREDDIRLAIKRLHEIQGGIVVVDRGKVVAEIELRLAGLMSIEEPEIVYKKYKDMIKKLNNYGVVFKHLFMTLSLISLPVIPEIRITDRGLIDVKRGKIISLIAS